MDRDADGVDATDLAKLAAEGLLTVGGALGLLNATCALALSNYEHASVPLLVAYVAGKTALLLAFAAVYIWCFLLPLFAFLILVSYFFVKQEQAHQPIYMLYTYAVILLAVLCVARHIPHAPEELPASYTTGASIFFMVAGVVVTIFMAHRCHRDASFLIRLLAPRRNVQR